MGREVLAVPRDPLAAGSRLPNDLLRDGAAPVTEAGDVLRLLGARRAAGRARARRCGAGRRGGALEERLLAEAARETGIDLERLAARVPEATPGALQAALATLEIEGRLARDRGRLRAVAAE
jgi:DNA processing protein